MTKKNLPIRFAKALFLTAVRKKNDKEILDELNSLKTVSAEKKMGELIKKISVLPKKQIREVIEKTFGQELSEITKNFLSLLIVNKSFNDLPLINKAYRTYYFKHRGIENIKIVTAKKMDTEEENELIKMLSEGKKENINLEFEQNPSLISGLKIYKQGQLTDLSTKQYLESLKKELLKAPLG